MRTWKKTKKMVRGLLMTTRRSKEGKQKDVSSGCGASSSISLCILTHPKIMHKNASPNQKKGLDANTHDVPFLTTPCFLLCSSSRIVKGIELKSLFVFCFFLFVCFLKRAAGPEFIRTKRKA